MYFFSLFSETRNTKISEKVKLQATVGFVQVRLEVVAIGINNIAAFVRA